MLMHFPYIAKSAGAVTQQPQTAGLTSSQLKSMVTRAPTNLFLLQLWISRMLLVLSTMERPIYCTLHFSCFILVET